MKKPLVTHFFQSAILSIFVVAGILLSLSGLAHAASVELTNSASASNLNIVQRTWSASTVDYNNDGLEDIWLGFHQRVDSKLMRNNGDGTYTPVAEYAWHKDNSLGEPIDRHDCEWGDVDKNGLQDAVCSVGRDKPNHVKGALDDNELWLQTYPGEFVDVGTEWGIGDPCGRGRHIAIADYNNDGWLDIFMGNDKPRGTVGDPCDDPAQGLPNAESKIFINQSGQGFVYAPQWGTTKPATGIGCADAIDYNHDGFMDILACNYKSTKPQLYRNNGGQSFTEVSASFAMAPITDATSGDINGDGIADLIMSDTKGFIYRLGTMTGFGPVVRIHATNSSNIAGWGVAVGDINADGKNDIYGLIHDTTLATNPDDVVFRNNGSLTFTKLTPPSATGNADNVITIHRYPSSTEFLVQNGREKMDGPIQIIQYQTGL